MTEEELMILIAVGSARPAPLYLFDAGSRPVGTDVLLLESGSPDALLLESGSPDELLLQY